MVLTKQRSAWHFDIRIRKTNIEQANEIKYFGVIFIISILGSFLGSLIFIYLFIYFLFENTTPWC